MGEQTVYVVPHTHWDREWYEPFQRFRLRLVDLLDDVVPRAEADPAFRFTLDGQMAVVDDYLEVRPEAAGRIAALVHSGQFAVGPWAILLDEFLCSGENIVRNLAWGLSRAEAFGGAMRIGYLPDMFGHCAQMPQILRQAGIAQACVWRGVPAAVTRHAFLWRAPDGTGLRTEYLPGGYGNAAELIADPGAHNAAEDHVRRMGAWYGDDPVLAMYGTDHSAPLPWLTSAVAAMDGTVHVRLSTLDEYLSRFDPADVGGLQVWTGELRSHARANILPGVLSNRPHLKRALSHAERIVERYAEPLSTLWAPPDRWPARLLELAWQRLVQCSCHDSVTGCGVDETAVQVAARVAEAEQIGTGIRDRTVFGLAGRAPADAALVVNPSPWPRASVVRLDLPAPPGPIALRLPDGTESPVQEIAGARPDPLHVAVRSAADLAALLRKGSLGLSFLAREVQRIEPGDRTLTVTMGRVGPGLTAQDKALAERVEAAGGDWTIRVLEEPRRVVYASVPVRPLGFTSVRMVAGSSSTVDGAVTVSAHALHSALLDVRVAEDGTLTLRAADGTEVAGVGRIVDGGDLGDLYNYAPDSRDRSGSAASDAAHDPDRSSTVDSPDEVAVTVVESGPLVGSLSIERRCPWASVATVVELRAGEPFCRLGIEFENRHPDHRVRLHVPLARPATRSYAEGQFAVVPRGLTSEGGHGEVPLPTFPAYSFVDAGGVAVLLDQVSEYELVDGTELAVTLLRATGMISRPDHRYRAEPAGPVIATPQAQCLGTVVRTDLAIAPHAGEWAEAGVLRMAEAFRCPPVAVEGTGPADVPLAAQAGLSVEGDGVVVGSLRRRDAQWWELRLVAMTDTPTTATVSGRFDAARRADLLGRPGPDLSTVDGQLVLPLRPWEIATVQLQAGD
jgi:alpha-mannosidase